MKKLLVFILCIVYLSTSAGTSIYFHYCMGSLADITLWHSSESECGRCGMDKEPHGDNGCCSDEHRLLKIQDDQKISGWAALNFRCQDMSSYFPEKPGFTVSQIGSTGFCLQRFRSRQIPIFLVNRNFRI